MATPKDEVYNEICMQLYSNKRIHVQCFKIIKLESKFLDFELKINACI